MLIYKTTENAICNFMASAWTLVIDYDKFQQCNILCSDRPQDSFMISYANYDFI